MNDLDDLIERFFGIWSVCPCMLVDFEDNPTVQSVQGVKPPAMSPTAETYLKTQQVALALGLSPSTVKRLVDAGHLRAARTEGKHRLIPVDEVERYARQRGLAVSLDERELRSGVEALAARRREAAASLTPPGTAQVELLIQALRRGRSGEARDLIVNTFEQSGPVLLADELIRPVMTQMGHDWEVQGIDIFQEHRATRLVKMALFELLHREQEETDEAAVLAIGAAPEGDPYMIPGLLCELTLRWLGWDVMNLGVNLPLSSLAKAVRAHRPRLVWLSVSHLENRDQFLRDYPAFFEAATACGTAVILGGQALGPDLRPRLVAASFGERMTHLAEFARLLSRPDAAAQDRSPRDRES
jgi:excisionase family DNA binding protein